VGWTSCLLHNLSVTSASDIWIPKWTLLLLRAPEYPDKRREEGLLLRQERVNEVQGE
jgi:hypothetical protein